MTAVPVVTITAEIDAVLAGLQDALNVASRTIARVRDERDQARRFAVQFEHDLTEATTALAQRDTVIRELRAEIAARDVEEQRSRTVVANLLGIDGAS